MSRYVGRFEKQPYEILPYAYTPTDDMEPGDTITFSDAVIVNAATGLTPVGVEDLTLVGVAHGAALSGDQVVTVSLSKGISGTRYKISVRCASALGYKYEDDFLVTVRER